MLGVLLAGLASLLGVALLVRLAWNWSIPDVFALGRLRSNTPWESCCLA
jgi:hypothetical protein